MEPVIAPAAAGNVANAAAASHGLQLPTFWQEKPGTWFNMCESVFTVRNITDPVLKYHHCIAKLPAETVNTIEDVVNNFATFADPYEAIKSRLDRAYGRSAKDKVQLLLDLPLLSHEKPSVLMDNILSLWPDLETKQTSKLLLGMFLRRLPEQMRSLLANSTADSPDALAREADAIWTNAGGRFAAAAVTIAAALPNNHRSPSPRRQEQRRPQQPQQSRGRDSDRRDGGNGRSGRSQSRRRQSRANWCFSHNQFGEKARTCEQRHCNWPAEN